MVQTDTTLLQTGYEAENNTRVSEEAVEIWLYADYAFKLFSVVAKSFHASTKVQLQYRNLRKNIYKLFFLHSYKYCIFFLHINISFFTYKYFFFTYKYFFFYI